jgi:hypothetical protein
MRLTTVPPPRDVAAAFPTLAREAKTTVRLHPREAPDVGVRESKVGGEILWPAEEPWPQCKEHKTPCVPVLQLFAKDLPELPCPGDADILQVVWCPRDHKETGAPIPLAFWRRSTIVTGVATSPTPVAPQEDYVPRVCRLHPERVVEYPPMGELPKALIDEIYAWCSSGGAAEDYEYLLSTASGTKLGGFVHWCQDPEIPTCSCGKKMKHLLTIASAEFDGGTYPRWLPVEEQHVWKAPYKERRAVQSAAGLMLGDMGFVALFLCERCEPWRFKSVFQCS